MATSSPAELFSQPFAVVAPLEFRSIGGEVQPEAAAVPDVPDESSGEMEQMVQLAFERGMDLGQRESAELYEHRLVAERALFLKAVQAFALERERYFHGMEHELVRLALAIAERVLHRESQMEPLLLTGAVRTALDALAEKSGAVLRVAPAQLSAWAAQMQTMPQPPQLRADESLADGECTLEMHVGTVDLGVRAQLAEIERGFFDLLGRRPESSRPIQASI